MLDLLEQGKRIINVDESWINETNYLRRSWSIPQEAKSQIEPILQPRLAVIAAIDTDGRVFFSLNHSNTDSDVMILFFYRLAEALDLEVPGWRDDTVLLLDNAPYHTSEETKDALHRLGFTLIYSGPYSYSAAPCELLFAALKTGNLNPLRQPTGKK